VHAITIAGPGGPENLRWSEVDDPVPGPGEVVVRVAASAVNRADIMQRQGFYPPPPGAPDYPGLECSGWVDALGPDVTGWRVGAEVCALLAGGGYAERVAVPAGQLLPRPDGVDLPTAGGLPEVACTVWSNLTDVAGLRPGERLLVHGGGSGIGTFAIQYAHALGARVFTTAGSPEKLARCAELGADMGVDYNRQDFAERVRDATGGRGVDVILDTIGGSYLPRNVASLATGGRCVTIGLTGGRRGELDLAALLAKRASVHATSLRARPGGEKAAIVAGVRRDVWPLLAAGRIRPVVDRAFPMPQAADAHRHVEASRHFGKVLLEAPGAAGPANDILDRVTRPARETP
jgi:putative PIG3 family NAD(P)H quinone oxidoreductase